MKARIRELGSLSFAVVLVATVCAVSLGALAPRQGLDDVAEVKEVTGSAPVLNLAVGDVPAPATYVAAIEALRWNDTKRHILDMRIESAQLVEVDAVTGAVKGRARSKADVAERIVGQRVLASVEASAAKRMKAPGQSTVRLVVVPNDKTVQVSVRDVVEGRAALTLVAAASRPSALATAATVVTGLSSYASSPGSQITIAGRGFGASQRDSWVAVCGARGTVVSWSDTSIVFTVPAGATKAGYVGVVVNGVTSNGLYFTPFAAPALSAVSPREGAPGTVVTLTGRGFGASQGSSWVSFGGVSAQVLSWSDTQVRVSVPRGVATGYVGVVVHGLSSNGVLFAAYGYPAIDALSSGHVLVDGKLTVTGRNFGAAKGQFILGGQAVATDSWANDRVTLTVPSSARSGYVGVVRSGGLTSNGVYLRVAPHVTGLSSWWGAPGSELTVSGRGFGSSPGAYSVSVGGRAADVATWSDTSIKVTVPDGASSGYVGVGTPAAFSNGSWFVVETRAHVSSVSTRTASAGDELTVTGDGFGDAKPASRVTVAGNHVCEVVSWSDTQAVVKVPSGAVSGYLGVVKQGIASNGVWLNVRSAE